MQKKLAGLAGLILCTNLFGQELYDLRNYQDTTNMMTSDDGVSQWVDLPFTFKFYGEDFTQARMASNGCLHFDQDYCQDYISYQLPAYDYTMYPFWTDIIGFSDSEMLYKGDDSKAIFGWYDMHEYYLTGSDNSFEVILFSNDSYEFRYGDLDIFRHNVLIGTQGTESETHQMFWFEDLDSSNSQTNPYSFNFMINAYGESIGWQGFYDLGNDVEEQPLEENFFEVNPEEQYNYEFRFDPLQQDTFMQEDFSDPFVQEQTFTNMGISEEEFYGYAIEEPMFFEPEEFMTQEIYVLQEVVGIDVFIEQDWQPREEVFFDEPMQEEIFEEMFIEERIIEEMQEEMQMEEDFFEIQEEFEVMVEAEPIRRPTEIREEPTEQTEEKEDRRVAQSEVQFEQQLTESIAISGAESTFLAPEPVVVPIESNAQQRISVQVESLAERMGAQAVEANAQAQMQSFAQSGGFSDQTQVTVMLGYNAEFSEYSNQEGLQDNMNWYISRTIYRNAVLSENRMNLFSLTNSSDNLMQQLISSQYNR
tara:strand:+ start:1217 stop:2815 length:1599 start_codon:yes stop_codon:yes gene_type:complete